MLRHLFFKSGISACFYELQFQSHPGEKKMAERMILTYLFVCLFVCIWFAAMLDIHKSKRGERKSIDEYVKEEFAMEMVHDQKRTCM